MNTILGLSYAINILVNKKTELEREYQDSVDVCQRIHKEPENFTWRWEDGGYWVSIYACHPEKISDIEAAITALRAIQASCQSSPIKPIDAEIERQKPVVPSPIWESVHGSFVFGWCECGAKVSSTENYCWKCGKRLEWTPESEG